MKKLAELRQAIEGLKAKGLAIADEAEHEDRDLTDAEVEELDAIQAEIAENERQIASLERLNETKRTMQPAATSKSRITVSEPKEDPAQGFKSISEFANAVVGAVQAGRIGGEVDHRLRAATPANTHQGGGTAGEGFMLPPQYRDEVWELVTGFDEFGPLIDEEPTSAREVKLGADETTPWSSTGVKAYWRAEAAQMSGTQLDTEGRSVPLHELYTLALATEELLEDAPRLTNRLTRRAAQAIAYKKNAAIVEGNGTGQPLGWMNSGALVTVAKESGQAADTIKAANVLKMYSRLLVAPGDRPFWLVNRDATSELMTMTIGDRPIWIPPTGLDGAPGGFLLGYPVRWSEFASTVGDLGDIQLISPQGYYGVRRSTGPAFASSIHLYFDYGIQAFRWTFRYGGQPHLSAPVSPNKGSSTKSHFVTLAERA